MEMWLARDSDSTLGFYLNQPKKNTSWGFWLGDLVAESYDIAFFPEVQWSDAEPTKVKLEIVK